MKEILEQLGQLFIIGFPDDVPSATFLNFIEETQLSGIIFFENNCKTYQNASENILTIKSVYRNAAPFIAIDQEGGRVCRLKGAPAEFRSAFSYGKNESIEKYIEDFSRASVCIESLGFNLNLAPVADIFTNEKNKVLRDRCFGKTPETTSLFVEASVTTLGKIGMLSCLKHFPGLGTAELDPHLETAEASYDQIIWEQREIIPFKAGLDKGADLVMTTHLKLPAFDEQIVTGSKTIIDSLLRNSLSFDGPVITDDLTMEGASVLGDYGERAVKAFKAGHDILLFGQNFDAAVEAYEYFVNAVERGEIDHNQIQASLNRISGVKFKLESSVMK